MANRPRHTILITRLLLVVLLLTSSGFTTVMRQCTMMAETSGQMDCCMPTRAADESHASGSTSPANASITQIDCHIATMIGGLPTTSGIIEKNSHSVLPKLVDLAVTIDSGVLSHLNTNSSKTTFSFLETHRPLSPDKRLLHSSLLI